MTQENKIEILQDALSNISKAKTLIDLINNNKDSLVSASESLESVSLQLNKFGNDLIHKVELRKKRFDSIPILEAVLVLDDSKKTRIVVGKPNLRYDEPWIQQSFYEAFKTKMKVSKITTTEDFPILVVDKKGNTILTITH